MRLDHSEHYTDPALYDFEYRRRRDDVHYYASLARGELAPGSHILELCCGTGRVTRELLRSGFCVTGMDLSMEMLTKARHRGSSIEKRFRGNLHLLEGDMRCFSLERQFDCIFMAFNSFEHLYTHADITDCLRCVRDHLAPDGLFAFDVQLPDLRWLTKDPDRRWARTTFRHPTTRQQLAYSTNHTYDPVAQVAHIRLYYEPLENGPLKETRVVHLKQRKFFPEELVALLRSQGFCLERRYGDFHGEDLDEFAENQVLLCRKDLKFRVA